MNSVVVHSCVWRAAWQTCWCLRVLSPVQIWHDCSSLHKLNAKTLTPWQVYAFNAISNPYVIYIVQNPNLSCLITLLLAFMSCLSYTSLLMNQSERRSKPANSTAKNTIHFSLSHFFELPLWRSCPFTENLFVKGRFFGKRLQGNMTTKSFQGKRMKSSEMLQTWWGSSCSKVQRLSNPRHPNIQIAAEVWCFFSRFLGVQIGILSGGVWMCRAI